MKAIVIYQFGPKPEVEFEKGGRLARFDQDRLGRDDYASPRAKRLYKALGASVDDDEMTLGLLPGNRWALIGLTVDGHKYAVEVTASPRFTGYIHGPTGRRFRSFDRAKAFGVSWGQGRGSGPNYLNRVQLDVESDRIELPWS